MDLIELRQALRRGWAIGLLVSVLVAIGAVIGLGPADRSWSAATTVLVTPRVERFESASPGILRIILPNVVVVARSRGVAAEAASSLGDLGDAEVEIDPSFLPESGVLTVTVTADRADAPAPWSEAVADALEDRYADDEYLEVSVLDRATAAHQPAPLRRAVDLAGAALLGSFAGLLTVFGLQRFRESADVSSRVRAGGLPVLADLVVHGRGPRPVFTGDEQASRVALSLANAPGVSRGSRFVVLSGDTRPAVAVIDAVRAGLDQVGLRDRYKVMLGPSLDDLAKLRTVATDNAVCIAVLDWTQQVEPFLRWVRAVIDDGVPVLGVVIVRRRVVRGRVKATTSSTPTKLPASRSKAKAKAGR